MKGSKRYIPATIFLLIVSGLLTFRSGAFCLAAAEIAELQKAFDDALPKLMHKREVPGVVVGIVSEGYVAWVKGYGYADKNRRILATEKTLFQAASISKPVSAWVVMKLVEEGRLDPDAPISKYLTRWRLPQSRFDNDRVTLRRILSHTAGLSIPGYLGFLPGARLQTLEESLTAAADSGNQPLAVVSPPGRGWRYSGGGYTLMQLVVEQVTKQSFAEFARRAVLAPLGMKDSSWRASDEVQSEMARAYDRAGNPLPDYGFTAEAAAGLISTAADLARFAAALMPGPSGEPQGRGVLKPQTLEQMLSPQPNSYNDLLFHGSHWGLGYGLKRLRSGGGLLVFHPGDNAPGWHGMIAALPEQRSGFVVLTNGEGGRTLRMEAFCLWFQLQGSGKIFECDESGTP
jgi:CubicO group peptidase (beta-lactamase class C family)